MFAVVTRIPTRAIEEDARAELAELVARDISRRPGFRGIVLLAAPNRDETVLVSLWERREDIDDPGAELIDLRDVGEIFLDDPGIIDLAGMEVIERRGPLFEDP